MIVITTMKSLPDDCSACPCPDCESGFCQADEERRYISDHKPDWCPLEDQPDIVRCKDCKNRPISHGRTGFDLEFPNSKCPCWCEDGYYSWYPQDNWYCANGERRDQDARQGESD